jgi:hypothetical protein
MMFVDAARHPVAAIAGLEARRDGVGDDDLRQRVGLTVSRDLGRGPAGHL